MKIGIISWNAYVPMLARAGREIPWLELEIFSSAYLDRDPDHLDKALESLQEADAVLLYRSSESFWDIIEEDIQKIGRRVPVICLSHDPSLWGLSSMGLQEVQTAYNYISLGGEDNFVNLLKFMARECLFGDLELAPPKKMPWEGLYHPQSGRSYFAGPGDYWEWYRDYSLNKGIENGPVVGLLLARHFWVNSILAVEDRLIKEIEGRGLRVVPIFCNILEDKAIGNKGGLKWSEEIFCDHEQIPVIDAFIKLSSFFMGSRKGEGPAGGEKAKDGVQLFQNLGVPVFQPVFSTSRTLKEWEQNPQGLGMEISWSVAMPEFEGVIEPFYLGGIARSRDESSGALVEQRVPHKERCSRLVSRIKKWIELRRKPVSERKVAFILHNNPCASVEAAVGGASSLDPLESVARILQAMHGKGYQVESPADGKELIDTIMGRKAISEFRWTTVDEIVNKGGALDLIPCDKYEKWWETFPEGIRARISEAWGEPPGEEVNGVPPAMLYQGKIVVTGVSYGNAVICAQPKRGCAGPRCDGRVCRILHDPDIPPPHQYLATYRYLEDEYEADVIIHVGTHGNLEFLPGKGVGLSESCLPDISIHQTPHLYIYNSDNPPEGTIAKRRSYAVLVDHLQTVLTQSGLYDQLEELDRVLGEYGQARITDKARAHALQHQIYGLIESCDLDKQIKASAEQDFDHVVKKTHEALTLIRNTRIEDGLHIFGQLPADKRRAEFIYSILRYDAGQEHSLRKDLARAMGVEVKDLLNDPGEINARWQKSNGRLMEEIDDLGREIVFQVINSQGPEDIRKKAGNVLQERLVRQDGLTNLEPVRERILDIDRRIGESLEIESLLRGFDGGFIPPGPSGLIARGREDILPTGRNFYSLDPGKIPTRAAYTVGEQLAQALIDKHLAEEKRCPENVAIYWMCTDIMWADGEGMAQILALLGVRPGWLSSGRVRNLEAIPLEELGRPRIDVTIRFSGITRDNFPDCMALVDRAVQLAASRDEPEDMNYVRKHTLEKLETGPDDREAWRKATLRLFSSKPGTYRAGVDLAVYASAWKNEEDISDIFLYFNQYAYGRDVFGQKSPQELKTSLETVDVTYNKVISDEHDLFGCCCYFSGHGGMTAAARTLKESRVRAYYGDSREPEKVEVRDLADEIRRVVRTKLLNPGWIEGMKRHGYKGAGDISARVGRIYGWEASTREVDDWIFDHISKTFVLDEENREFFKQNNPWALEEMGRRLLEAENRGLWQADPGVLEELKQAYLEMEGWLEGDMGEVRGDFQGGSVDVFSAEDVEQFNNALQQMKKKMK